MKKLLTLTVAILGISCQARLLMWDEERPDLVATYNVYDCDAVAPHAAWEFFATTATNGCEVPIDSAQKFFTVTVVCFDGVELPEIQTGQQRVVTKLQTPRMR